MKVIGENEVKIQLKASTGPQGPVGPQGPKGDKGDRGEPGPRGLTGATGPKGDKGDKGDKGATGAVGPQGPAGPKGDKGDTGATGPAGANGKDYVLTEADKQAIAGMVEATGGGGAAIDDTTPGATTTYSSQKIESELTSLNEANATQDTEIAKKANDADLAKVAKSGSYNDLTGKPTIPTVPESLKNPNKLTFTGAVTAEYDGSAPVSGEIPSGGGSEYELPIASPTTLGGVQPAAKTDEMTQAVGVDDAGGLWTMAGRGSAGDENWELINEITFEEDVNNFIVNTDFNGDAFELKKAFAVFKGNHTLSNTTSDKILQAGFDGYMFKLNVLRCSQWPHVRIYYADCVTYPRRIDQVWVGDGDTAGLFNPNEAPYDGYNTKSCSLSTQWFYSNNVHITSFRGAVDGNTYQIASGSKAKIYGVRV